MSSEYYTINDTSELSDDNYKYIEYSITGGNLEVYKEEFQTENIIVPPLRYSAPGLVFIGLNEYLNRFDLADNNVLILYLIKKDLSNLDEISMHSTLRSMRLSDEHTRNLQINHFWFYKCNFGEISDKRIGAGVFERTNRTINLIECNVERFEILDVAQPPSYSCMECQINYLFQISENRNIFSFKNNSINQLVTSAQSIHLKNVTLELFHHRNLDTVNISTDNSKIAFNRKILKQIDKKDESGYWNTFNYLHTYVKSLNSEKLAIEKYIAYFSSRADPIKKALFAFHGGYTKILSPAILMLLCLFGTFYFTSSYLGYTGNTFATVAYPVDFLKNIILKNFSFGNKISWLKIGLFFTELAYIFSFFCFGLAVKKKWGFKIWK